MARYCAWPTQASAYLTGAMAIERARDDWVAAGGSLRGFHDLLAGSGAMPVPWPSAPSDIPVVIAGTIGAQPDHRSTSCDLERREEMP